MDKAIGILGQEVCMFGYPVVYFLMWSCTAIGSTMYGKSQRCCVVLRRKETYYAMSLSATRSIGRSFIISAQPRSTTK